MKKTLNINLNKKVFHIDEDAYSLLDNYLQNLRNYFRKEQGLEEIMTDFEGRIEELLSEKPGDVVSISEVENVIRQLGNPSDFGVESPEEKGDNPSSANNPQQTHKTSGKKKFYRDPHNKLVGGVCSGVAAYFGWDVTWVRIATVLLVLLGFPIDVIFLPGWLVILYITLWIVVPAARTAEQRLEMSGEPITVENIGKKVSEQVNANVLNYEKNNGCAGAFLKICLIALAIIIGLPLLFALAIVLIVLFAVFIGAGAGVFGGLVPEFINILVVKSPVMAAIGGFLLIGIPVISLIYIILSAIFKWKPLHKSIKITALIAWILSIFLLLFSGWKVDWQHLRNWDKDNTFWNMEKIKGDRDIIEHAESFSKAIKTLEIKGNLVIDLEIDSLSGDSSNFTIEGDANIINNYLNIERRGDKLVLNPKRKYRIEQSKQYKLLLKTSGFEKIDIMGAANLETAGLKVPRLSVNVTGASYIKMADVNMTNLEIDCAGASNATLTGNVTKATLKAVGASEVQANELTADTVYANAVGASKIKCLPVAFLDADAVGASIITYKTEPERKNVKAIGASIVKTE
jgi:phage shock protein PspC (stress-responsive transcriptional regulator)